jgi:hypothetical protein
VKANPGQIKKGFVILRKKKAFPKFETLERLNKEVFFEILIDEKLETVL